VPIIIDTDRAHPLTYLVEMGSVKYIYDGFAVDGPEGSRVLFDANVGPLLVIAQRDGFDLKRYQRHIQAHLGIIPARLSDCDRPIEFPTFWPTEFPTPVLA